MNLRKYLAVVLGLVASLTALSSDAQETIISLAQAKEMALENNKNIKRATQNIGPPKLQVLQYIQQTNHFWKEKSQDYICPTR
ncbi:hypothetical protein [Pedobacter sp. NJ-S-72]